MMMIVITTMSRGEGKHLVSFYFAFHFGLMNKNHFLLKEIQVAIKFYAPNNFKHKLVRLCAQIKIFFHFIFN
jgi:hypothetical protein